VAHSGHIDDEGTAAHWPTAMLTLSLGPTDSRVDALQQQREQTGSNEEGWMAGLHQPARRPDR
jgi:hypothetical protein